MAHPPLCLFCPFAGRRVLPRFRGHAPPGAPRIDPRETTSRYLLVTAIALAEFSRFPARREPDLDHGGWVEMSSYRSVNPRFTAFGSAPFWRCVRIPERSAHASLPVAGTCPASGGSRAAGPNGPTH